MADEESSTSSEEDILHHQTFESNDDDSDDDDDDDDGSDDDDSEDDGELGKLAAATAIYVKKTTRQSFTGTLTERTVSHFQAWNQEMVRTAALGQVLDKLNTGTTWLTIKGNPGEGKTTVGYMALEELHRCGRQVFEVRSPDEFNEVISTCPRPVIMVDDVFGNLEFDQNKWSNWEPVLNPLLKEREHKSHEEEDQTSKKGVTVILIGRGNVLNSASVDLGRLSDFLTSDKHVVYMDHSLDRGVDEKRAIWESISRSSDIELDKMTIAEILRIEGPHGFPHVCRLFATIYKEHKAISAIEFFKKPLDFLNKSISYLFKDSDKVKLFREMLKNEGKISMKELRNIDGSYKLIQIAKELGGPYLRFVDDKFVFDHPSIYDSVAFHMCSLDPKFVIQQCHLSFIHERIRLVISEHAKSTESSLVVYVDRSYADDLAERFAAEIMAKNFVHVLSHQAFRDGEFVRKVMSEIKTPLKTLLQFPERKPVSNSDTLLCFVPSSKSPELLRYIDNCPEIELTEDDEKDVLYGTCKHAASKVLAYLKDTRMSLNINVRFNRLRHNSTPLIIAAETKDVEFVNKILSLKPDLDARNQLDRTALHYLCQNGLVSAVSKVIDSGVDIDVLDNENNSPLCYAIAYNHLEIVNLLIQNGATINEKSLISACEVGILHIVEILFENESNLNKEVTLTNAFLAASQGGNTGIMELLVEKGASVTSSYFDMAPLHVACWYNQPQAATWLLQKGADLNSLDWEGDTALHRAAWEGSKGSVEVLLKAGAKINIRNKEGDTALHRAAWHGSKDRVDLLLKTGATLNIQNKEGDTALYLAASGSYECVNVLLNKGATVNLQNKEGNTSLHRAAWIGSKECVDVLLKKGATVNIQNQQGDTVLHSAAESKSKECIAIVLEVGPTAVNKQNAQGDTALHRASWSGSKECIEELLKTGARVNIQNKKHNTALHKAAVSGSIDCVDFLLKAGATVNEQNEEGNTALHRAAMTGSIGCIEVLLKAEATVNLQNKEGNTALHRAVVGGSKECVDLLLKSDTNRTQKVIHQCIFSAHLPPL